VVVYLDWAGKEVGVEFGYSVCVCAMAHALFAKMIYATDSGSSLQTCRYNI